MAAIYPADTFKEGVDLTIESSNQLAQVVRGDANTEVMVADGSTIPSIRKAQADSMYFKEPELWTTRQTETDYLQLKKYIDPTTNKESWWFAKSATVLNPVVMGTSPFGDDNWTLYTPEDLFISGKAEYESIYQALKGKAAEAGYNLVRGSFEEGGTLTSTTDVLWHQATGKYYNWFDGSAKTVVAGSTPATSGGIGAGAWVDRTDVTLRDELNVVVKVFESVADMVADTTLTVGQIVETIGYFSGSELGSNKYKIVASGTGTAGGGSFINLTNGLQAKGIFTQGVANIYQFGAKGDGVTDDAAAIQAAVLSSHRNIFFPVGVYLITTPINIPATKIGLKLYGASKSNNTSCILTANDIEMFQDHGAYTLFEGLSFQCNFGAHSKMHIQCYNAEHPSFINCIFNGADNQTATGSGVGFGDGAGGVGGTMGIIDRCVFNHASIDVKTWDVHITNSWVWANSRAYGIRAIGSVGNLTIIGTDILPPVVTRSNRKAGIYLSGAVTQTVISACYIDGNPTLATGIGILAEDGVIGLSVDSLRANENCQEVIVLDSVINPIIKGCTFMRSNRAGFGAHTILLQQTKTQAMLNPVIVNNSFVQTSAVTGTLGSAIYVDAGVSRNKIKIEDNAIYQPGAGGGFLDQEINLVNGAFGNKQQGSLRGNATTRKKCSVSASATFNGTDTYVIVPLNSGGELMYAPRIDQIRVNCSVALPYAVQLIDASSVRIIFTAGGTSGAFYVSVELD